MTFSPPAIMKPRPQWRTAYPGERGGFDLASENSPFMKNNEGKLDHGWQIHFILVASSDQLVVVPWIIIALESKEAKLFNS